MSANCPWTLFKADSDSAGLEWGLRACISSVSPGDADTEVQGLHLGYCCCYLITAVVFDSLGAPWTVARQTPLSMEFSRQEYWGGLPFPSPEDCPNPGIEPTTAASKVDSLSLSHQGNPFTLHRKGINLPLLGTFPAL